MKKFEFSLSKMRDFKKQMLESEKGKLIKLCSDRDTFKGRIRFLESDYKKVHDEMSECIVKGVTVMEIKMFQYRKECIRREQQQLQFQVNIIEGSIERQRRTVLGLSKEVSGIDKLEEKQLAEYNKQLAKENELIISEYIVTKFVNSKAAATAI